MKLGEPKPIRLNTRVGAHGAESHGTGSHMMETADGGLDGKHIVAEPGLHIHEAADPEPIAPHCRIAVADTTAAHTVIADTTAVHTAVVDTAAGGSHIPVMAAAVDCGGLGNS